MLHADLSADLLVTIFMPRTALHDGAVIIRGEQVVAAGALLPLAETTVQAERLGTRHRAALGIAEQTDAVVVVGQRGERPDQPRRAGADRAQPERGAADRACRLLRPGESGRSLVKKGSGAVRSVAVAGPAARRRLRRSASRRRPTRCAEPADGESGSARPRLDVRDRATGMAGSRRRHADAPAAADRHDADPDHAGGARSPPMSAPSTSSSGTGRSSSQRSSWQRSCTPVSCCPRTPRSGRAAYRSSRSSCRRRPSSCATCAVTTIRYFAAGRAGPAADELELHRDRRPVRRRTPSRTPVHHGQGRRPGDRSAGDDPRLRPTVDRRPARSARLESGPDPGRPRRGAGRSRHPRSRPVGDRGDRVRARVGRPPGDRRRGSRRHPAVGHRR